MALPCVVSSLSQVTKSQTPSIILQTTCRRMSSLIQSAYVMAFENCFSSAAAQQLAWQLTENLVQP